MNDTETIAQAYAYSYGREDASDHPVFVQQRVHGRFIAAVRDRGLTIDEFRAEYNRHLESAIQHYEAS